MVYPSRLGKIAVAILALSSICATAQGQAFSPPKNISNNTDYSFTPQVAVDDVGNIYAVWQDDTATNSNILFSRSIDGGATFSPPLNVSQSSGSSFNPLISVDRQVDGIHINVVWINDAPGNNDVFFSRSTNGGDTFSAPLNLSNDPADSLSPQLAVDGTGKNINVVWESDDITFGILFSHSTDGGATFSPPVPLATNTGGSFGAQLAMAADGSINVVWEDDSNSGSTISYIRLSINGVPFSAPKNLSANLGNSTESQIAVDAGGNIDVIFADSTPGASNPGNFNIFFSRSTDQGLTFSSPKNLSSSLTNSLHAHLAVDATGGIYAVWEENVAIDAGNKDIFFTRSSDSGATFSAPTNLSNNFGNSSNASLVVDAAGGINLSWEDDTPGLTNIFFTDSQDAGVTFSTPQNLSNDSGSSTEAQIVADKNGDLNVLWSDDAPGVNQAAVSQTPVNQILFSRFTNPQAVKHPPVANAGSDQFLECACAGNGGTPAWLDGSASTDPDKTALTYAWTDEVGNPMGTGVMAQVSVTMGTHAFTLTVTNAEGLTSTATTHVTVRDTKAPSLTLSLSPNNLWPPNHKLVQITATVVVSDTCDARPAVQLMSITSSDPLAADDVQAVGGGPVPFGTDVRSFLLRADRAKFSPARIYTATYTAKDASGNTTTAAARVRVGASPQIVAPNRFRTEHKKRGKGIDKERE
jgi:hypothetical protein